LFLANFLVALLTQLTWLSKYEAGFAISVLAAHLVSFTACFGTCT